MVGNAIFSAITGVTVAAVVLFTRLAVPEMLKRGYNARLAVGVVAGSAMLGMLIPPSVLMIIYAVLTEISIGDIYNAGIVPGIILAGAFSLAIYIIAILRPEWVGRDAAAQNMKGMEAMTDDESRSLVAQIGSHHYPGPARARRDVWRSVYCDGSRRSWRRQVRW